MSADRRLERTISSAAKATAASGVVAAMVLASPVGAAAAADGPAIVVNRETVQAELEPSGKLDVARLFSQLVINGQGKTTILDPTSGKNIRDLDGFSPPDVKNGVAEYVVDVNGRTTRRTVSDFTGKLPLAVTAEYTLDGKKAEAQDLVGKSGVLDVKYTIENVTATPTPITYTVNGKTTTKTVDLVTPYVGQLTTTVPASFTEIDAVRADVAGDGRGGQLLAWTMVLFEPIGQVKQTFGYTARVKDLQLPATHIQAVPVPPERKPELAFGIKGFYDGQAAAGNVAYAGGAIDSNLAKLRDGAGDLLAGLTKLAAGATALKEGLAGEAAPGARQLADGLGTAKAGSSKLAAGADKLGAGLTAVKDGSSQLSEGLGAASAGSEKLLDGSQDLATGAGLTAAGAKSLSDGLAQISAGLDQLADAQKGLPAALAGAKALRAAVDAIAAQLGPVTKDGTLLNGLSQISAGVGQLGGSVIAGLDNTSTTNPGLKQAVGGLKSLSQLQQMALTTGIPANALAAGSPAIPGVKSLLDCVALAAVCGLIDGVATGTDYGLAKSIAVEDQILSGIPGKISDISAGVGALQTGITKAMTGVSTLSVGIASTQAGVPSLANGLDALIAGLTTAVAGVSQLATGAKTAATGATALADGTGQVAAGAGKLSEEGAIPLSEGLAKLYLGSKSLDDGLGQLADGGGQAVDGVHAIDDGLTKLADGGAKLADGLEAAADGSGQLADGLQQAKAGGGKIQAGAEELRTAAAVPLANAGQTNADKYAEEYAIMLALNEKAADGGLPYGAPEGATGSAAFDFTLAAATSATQDNTTRGIAALALLALASASGMFVRRRVLGQ